MGRIVRVVPGPLDGVRVLDFTRVLAGPHATRMLTDLGADVIKVEPPAGDLTRFANPRVNGLSTYFVQQNVGKRNVSIDLGDPRGIELALRLAEHCDVLAENYRPGVMDRLGLGPATVAARNPRLVYASISGYGSTGPWVNRRAYAPVVGAETGLTKDQGDARGAIYANDPHSHADVYTSLEATVAILAALYQRERTGRGDTVEITMAETMLYVNEHLHDQLFDGPSDGQWIRSFSPGDYLVFTLADGQVVIVSGHPAERGTFELFLGALELEHLQDDPRFVDVASRMAHFDELRELLLAAGAEIPDATTFEEQFAKHRLAVGVLRSARELAESEWAAARGAIVEVSDRGGGTIRVPNAPWRFGSTDVAVSGVPKYRGEDNRTVLAEVLGYDEATIDALEADGVLSSRPAELARVTLSFPVVPMRATLSRLPTDDSHWAFEVKWDGYRTLAFIESGRVRLQSSNLYDVTAKYPELAPLGAATGARRVVLDGELVVLDDDGRPRFELIQRHAIENREAAFYAFDVLSIDDHDTISLPYEDRRRLLAEVVEDGPNWSVPAHRIGDGQALLDATAERGLEGVMAKRLGSTYRPGTRTKEWRKVKHRQRAEVVIGGYTAGTGNRTSSFGALLVGRWEGDSLAFAGGVGTGFTQRRLDELSKRLHDLRTPTSARSTRRHPPPTGRGATWVEPVLTGEGGDHRVHQRGLRPPGELHRSASRGLILRFLQSDRPPSGPI